MLLLLRRDGGVVFLVFRFQVSPGVSPGSDLWNDLGLGRIARDKSWCSESNRGMGYEAGGELWLVCRKHVVDLEVTAWHLVVAAINHGHG